MAPLPKRRHSTARSGKRRRVLTKIQLTACPNCGEAKQPHLVCPACGYYKDRLVLPGKKKEKKNEVQS